MLPTLFSLDADHFKNVLMTDFFSAKRFMNIQKFSHQFPWSHVKKDSFRILTVVPAFHNSQQKLGGIVLEIQNQVNANLKIYFMD